jgi:phosphate starvation-inducible PhoH-like protein
LAVACALRALESRKVAKVILSRPVVEAGERLGFLPGDLMEKVNPYLRPLYDAFYSMLGPERFRTWRDNDVVEIVPLAYMRGRTFEDAFMILDEAQNMDWHELKTVISRIGENAKIIVLGDLGQIDTHLRRENTGLHKLVNADHFKDSSISSYIDLKKQYRSALCDLVEDIETELQRDNH